MKRLIIFLVRRRLGLKKEQEFRFTNQKTKAIYYFTNEGLIKTEHYLSGDITCQSGVSLNWLLNDKCKIVKNLKEDD